MSYGAKMKVLVVTNMYPSPSREGWGAFIKTQVDSLADKDVAIEVIHIEGYKSSLNYLRGIATVIHRCLTNRYDLVHAHYGLSGLVARMQFRYPLIISYCGDDLYGHADENGNPTRSSLVSAWVHKQLARWVDGVIVKSRAMAQLLPIKNAEVIPNGVNFDLFRPLDRYECRKALGLSADKKYIFFPYDPRRPRKNFGAVKEAVELLKHRIGEVEILTVNKEPNNRIPLYMNAADALVLPSFWEGSPNAVKEALACNTRVVATDVGDVRELLQHLEGCAICTTEPHDIANKLQTVLTGPENKGGRASIEHLRLEKIAERVLEQYRSVLKDTART